MSAREHAEIHLGLATHGRDGADLGDPDSRDARQHDALIAIAYLLVSVDDHLTRLAEGLTHGPARHTHAPSPLLKSHHYNPAEEGE